MPAQKRSLPESMEDEEETSQLLQQSRHVKHHREPHFIDQHEQEEDEEDDDDDQQEQDEEEDEQGEEEEDEEEEAEEDDEEDDDEEGQHHDDEKEKSQGNVSAFCLSTFLRLAFLLHGFTVTQLVFLNWVMLSFGFCVCSCSKVWFFLFFQIPMNPLTLRKNLSNPSYSHSFICIVS